MSPVSHHGLFPLCPLPGGGFLTYKRLLYFFERSLERLSSAAERSGVRCNDKLGLAFSTNYHIPKAELREYANPLYGLHCLASLSAICSLCSFAIANTSSTLLSCQSVCCHSV